MAVPPEQQPGIRRRRQREREAPTDHVRLAGEDEDVDGLGGARFRRRSSEPATARAKQEEPATRSRGLSAKPSLVAVGREEGVAVVGRRYERLLDRPRRDPADQVPHRAGLVVRSRRARAAERLLADDRARRLVVDVEVASRVLELLVRELDRRAVAGEDRARQPVRGGAVDQVERLLVLLLRIDVGGDDRAEELVPQKAEARGRASRSRSAGRRSPRCRRSHRRRAPRSRRASAPPRSPPSAWRTSRSRSRRP